MHAQYKCNLQLQMKGKRLPFQEQQVHLQAGHWSHNGPRNAAHARDVAANYFSRKSVFNGYKQSIRKGILRS